MGKNTIWLASSMSTLEMSQVATRCHIRNSRRVVAFFRDDLRRRKQRKVRHSELKSEKHCKYFGNVAGRLLNFADIKSKLILGPIRNQIGNQSTNFQPLTRCAETDKVSIEAAKETQPRGQLSHNKTNTQQSYWYRHYYILEWL